MDNLFVSLFDSELGKHIYSLADTAIREYGMDSKIKDGVLVGLSGGPDSVLLLHFLLEYRRRNTDFPILAVHINHMIRGAAADSDEEFSRSLCKRLDVEFISERIDVPALAKEEGSSLEECARNVRYQKFSDLIASRTDISTIAVAHNADDNLETVLLNIFRGTGTRGGAGIPPVRENIIRPLIYVKKQNIVELLKSSDVGYVIDATNLETEYKRNRIRNNIVPELYKICDDPIDKATRFSKNLRIDEEYFDSVADNILCGDKEILSERFNGLHKSVQARVLLKLAKSAGAEMSSVAINSICSLVKSKNKFSYSLPGGKKFVCEYGVCSVKEIDGSEYDYLFELHKGKNVLSDYDADFYVFDDKKDFSYLNVYKFSIQADLSSAIIIGSLYLRPKEDGDTVFYGGITRKLKKMFSDAKIPQSLRKSIPVLCDEKGVVWVPGFGVRDDGVKAKGKLFAALAIGRGETFKEKRLRSASEFR